MNSRAKIELEPSELELLKEALLGKRQLAVAHRDEADREVERIDLRLFELSNVKAEEERSHNQTKAKRIKKGESEKCIIEFLQNSNGTGATLNDVIKSTGTTYATTRRILDKLLKANKAALSDSRWKWIVSPTSVFHAPPPPPAFPDDVGLPPLNP